MMPTQKKHCYHYYPADKLAIFPTYELTFRSKQTTSRVLSFTLTFLSSSRRTRVSGEGGWFWARMRMVMLIAHGSYL